MSNDVTKIRQSLAAQHPLHGIFAEVFEDLGGKEFLLEWGSKNPGRFLSMMTKMTPNMMPQQGIQGDVNITVNQNLVPTALDNITLDEQGRVIDELA